MVCNTVIGLQIIIRPGLYCANIICWDDLWWMFWDIWTQPLVLTEEKNDPGQYAISAVSSNWTLVLTLQFLIYHDISLLISSSYCIQVLVIQPRLIKTNYDKVFHRSTNPWGCFDVWWRIFFSNWTNLVFTLHTNVLCVMLCFWLF